MGKLSENGCLQKSPEGAWFQYLAHVIYHLTLFLISIQYSDTKIEIALKWGERLYDMIFIFHLCDKTGWKNTW